MYSIMAWRCGVVKEESYAAPRLSPQDSVSQFTHALLMAQVSPSPEGLYRFCKLSFRVYILYQNQSLQGSSSIRRRVSISSSTGLQPPSLLFWPNGKAFAPSFTAALTCHITLRNRLPGFDWLSCSCLHFPFVPPAFS